MLPRSVLFPLLSLSLACIDKEAARRAIHGVSGARLDEVPAVLNRELPFRYPPALYASRVQGNVMLRLFVDSTGGVLPESTMVVESSGYPGLDSAAVKGSQALRFSPAQHRGRPLGVAILLPVYFRHPRGHPLPGDSVIRQGFDTRGQRPEGSARIPGP
jgi:TonB family protein